MNASKVINRDPQQLPIKVKIPEYQLSNEARNKIEKYKEIEKTVNRENLFYVGKKDTCYFRHYPTCFTRNILNHQIS